MIGVLALQGDFEKHETRLEELGVHSRRVNKSSDLEGVEALVLPGGESSVLLKLTDNELRETLRTQIVSGLPTFATCAGVIFLASNVEHPAQASLGVLDVDVRRNAYGRQKDSFISDELIWTTAGKSLLSSAKMQSEKQTEGVFIRAPKLTRIGAGVETLIEFRGEPVCVRERNIFAMTFHPELSTSGIVHEVFLKTVFHLSGNH